MQEMKAFKLNTPFLKNISDKLIIQLPRFISENDIAFYQKEIKRLFEAGISQFMLSHVSQKLLFDPQSKIRLFTSENVYVLNDAAAAFLQNEHISNWVYPLENDFPNLISGKDHRGIVPLLYYPELFYHGCRWQLNDDDLSVISVRIFVSRLEMASRSS